MEINSDYYKTDTFEVVRIEDINTNYLYLCIPYTNDLIQLAFNNLEMFSTFANYPFIPFENIQLIGESEADKLILHINNDLNKYHLVDNKTHVKCAKMFLEMFINKTENDGDMCLTYFMLNLYKCVVDDIKRKYKNIVYKKIQN
jgi:hypothetical protein